MSRVFVAMSGGVDSSVAAALLLETGHDVTGVTMQLWPSSDADGGCCSVNAVRDARRVCDLLGIPHYALNFRDAFERDVVTPFADAYARGETPNPCIVCNDRLKFADLLAKVMAQEADYLATGHYARIVRDEDGVPWLARGIDARKDQSYFLYRLTVAQMERVLFPLGSLTKTEVRAIATRLGLPVAEKPESQEVCFAAAGEHSAVVGTRHPEALVPGPIVDRRGELLGRHAGLAHYTVGQRRGLGLSSQEPLYVLSIDANQNRLVVGGLDDLEVGQVEARDAVWHSSPAMEAESVVRYRMTPVASRASYESGRLSVTFRQPVRGVAPGQAVVCYAGERVLGGGVIECAD